MNRNFKKLSHILQGCIIFIFLIVEDDENDIGGHFVEEDYQNAENETFYRVANGFEMNNDSSPNIFEGDILLDEFNDMGEVTTNISRRWPKNGDVVIEPFTFPSSASKQHKSDIARVVLEFQSKTCIRYQMNYRLKIMRQQII